MYNGQSLEQGGTVVRC